MIPHDFLNNLNQAANVVHGKKENLTEAQVNAAHGLWGKLSDSEKKNKNAYLVIIQGLDLLSGLKPPNLEDKVFLHCFALLKDLPEEALNQANAYKQVAQQVLKAPAAPILLPKDSNAKANAGFRKANKEAKEQLPLLYKTFKELQNESDICSEDKEWGMKEIRHSIGIMQDLLNHGRKVINNLEKDPKPGDEYIMGDIQSTINDLYEGPWANVRDILETTASGLYGSKQLPDEFVEIDKAISLFLGTIEAKIKAIRK